MDVEFGEKIYNAINKDKGIVFECGANDGTSGSPSEYLSLEKGYKRILADANPYCHKKDKNILHAALSNEVKDVILTIPTWGKFKKCGMGATIEYGKEHWNNRGEFEEVKMQTTTYAILMKELDITHMDVVIWDVEGHEIDCVNGMKGGPMPDCLVVESDRGMELSRAIEDLGYKIVDSHANNWICVWK